MPTAELAFGHVTEACHALRHMLSPPLKAGADRNTDSDNSKVSAGAAELALR